MPSAARLHPLSSSLASSISTSALGRWPYLDLELFDSPPPVHPLLHRCGWGSGHRNASGSGSPHSPCGAEGQTQFTSERWLGIVH